MTAFQRRRLALPGAPIAKAKAKTLYVYRSIENAADIIEWAKGQGFTSTLLPADMHVTIAFSKIPLNWARLGDDYTADDPNPSADRRDCMAPCAVSWSDGGAKQRRIAGGVREVKALGDKGAIVLAFQSPSLTERWCQFLRIGASWDYAGYAPHVTISYKGGVDPKAVKPYSGEIVLGEECWEEIEEGAGENVAEEPIVKASLDSIGRRLEALEKAKLDAEAA